MELFFKKINKLNKGFTLVETLIAISIFSMTIVTMMSILGSGVSDTNYAKRKMIAGYLAQEGIEHVINMRDTDVITDSVNGWSKFESDVSSITTPNTNDNFYRINDSDFVGFTRTLQVDNKNPDGTINPDEVKVSSTVSWTQPSGPQSVIFSEDLFNWVE